MVQYYANDMIENDGSSMSRLPVDDYQPQLQVESTIHRQPKYDDYYTMPPGENYYTDYENVEQNQAYTTNVNFDNNLNEVAGSSAFSIEQHNSQSSKQQHNLQPSQPAQSNQQSIEYLSNNQPNTNVRIPNYLLSDTDDSQTGYQNHPSNKISQESDFDYSTNSEMN